MIYSKLCLHLSVQTKIDHFKIQYKTNKKRQRMCSEGDKEDNEKG
jgi:hypothetical protein